VSRRYQLNDAQWRRVESLFSHHRIFGCPTREPREVPDGILWMLHIDALCRDLAERFDP